MEVIYIVMPSLVMARNMIEKEQRRINKILEEQKKNMINLQTLGNGNHVGKITHPRPMGNGGLIHRQESIAFDLNNFM